MTIQNIDSINLPIITPDGYTIIATNELTNYYSGHTGFNNTNYDGWAYTNPGIRADFTLDIGYYWISPTSGLAIYRRAQLQLLNVPNSASLEYIDIVVKCSAGNFSDMSKLECYPHITTLDWTNLTLSYAHDTRHNGHIETGGNVIESVTLVDSILKLYKIRIIATSFRNITTGYLNLQFRYNSTVEYTTTDNTKLTFWNSYWGNDGLNHFTEVTYLE